MFEHNRIQRVFRCRRSLAVLAVVALALQLPLLAADTNSDSAPRRVPEKLADPEATEAARELMRKLVNDYGHRTWSGLHYVRRTGDMESIEKLTGRKPLIVEGDLIDYSATRVAHTGIPTVDTMEQLVSLGQTGHVIAMSWHWNAPTNLIESKEHPWWAGFYTAATTFDIATTLAHTNSVEYRLLLKDIDAIAAQLRKAADAGVPMLWRPLHESDGRWFWWGAKGPDAFKELWRLLFHRLTVEHHLHNLIWVLASANPDWYPGDDVVDVIGIDAYPKDHGATLKSDWDALKARYDGKKLLALTEFGGVPDIERMQNSGVWWSWFSSWNSVLRDRQAAARAWNEAIRTYNCPCVVTMKATP